MFGFDFGCARKLRTQRRHDFDALDRVDAQIGVKAHVRVQHLDRIAGFVSDHCEQNLADPACTHSAARCCRSGNGCGGSGSGSRRIRGGWHSRHSDRHSGRHSGRLVARTQKIGNLLQRLQRTQMLGFDFRRARQSGAQRRHDFNPLDRINPEVSVETHAQVEHLHRIAGFVRHDVEQYGGDVRAAGTYFDRSSGRNRRGRSSRQHSGTSASSKKNHHLLKRLQRTQMLGFDLGCLRQFAAQGRHDLDALD